MNTIISCRRLKRALNMGRWDMKEKLAALSTCEYNIKIQSLTLNIEFILSPKSLTPSPNIIEMAIEVSCKK